MASMFPVAGHGLAMVPHERLQHAVYAACDNRQLPAVVIGSLIVLSAVAWGLQATCLNQKCSLSQ